jgi:nucleoside-diphosphate-sugar epimerase
MADRVVVTGGSGKAGRWIVKEFLEHGYEVLNLDWRQPEQSECPTLIVDLNDGGQVHAALAQYALRDRKPIRAVVHMAAIPVAFRYPNDVTFRNNVMSTYNVLEAAANLGIGKAVLASSESSYGIVFAEKFFAPRYVPIDEGHPQLPEDSYGLSKVVNEVTGEAFHRRTGMQVVSFRLGNILDPDDYPRVKAGFSRPEERLRILWSYIDVRDVASACRLAVEKDGLGAVPLILAADDTSSDVPSRELLARFLPGVEVRGEFAGRQSFLCNSEAKRLLHWEPKYRILEQ